MTVVWVLLALLGVWLLVGISVGVYVLIRDWYYYHDQDSWATWVGVLLLMSVFGALVLLVEFADWVNRKRVGISGPGRRPRKPQ